MAQTLIYNTTVTEVTPITLPTFDEDVDNVQQLDDEPNDVGGLTAQQLKAVFDKTGADLATFLNDELIPQVVADDATEQARQLAEGERVANEQERVNNENARVSAETARANAEGNRTASEGVRVTNENGRVSAEDGRVVAEMGRVNAENARVAAEAARESAETGYVTQAQTAAGQAASSALDAAAQADRAQQYAEQASVPAVAGVYNIICEDRTTHVRYAVIFDDGILKGVPVSGTAEATDCTFIDRVTGEAFILAVDNGIFIIEEAT